VTFTDTGSGQALGTAPLNAGTATISTTALPPGARSIVASYSGDGANVARASTPLVVTIGKATSAVALTSSSLNPTHASFVTLTATITGINPGGTVTFSSTNPIFMPVTVNVTNGKAELNTNAFAIGQYPMIATYSGDSNNAAAASSAVVLNVVLPKGTLVLTASHNTPPVGENLTLTANLTGITIAATGTVTFKVGTKTLGVSPVLNGRTAIFTTKSLELGAHSIIAHYSGDSLYPSMDSSALAITVKPPTPTVSSTPVNVNYGSGGPIDLSSAVSADTTCVEVVTPPSNGTVTVRCNNPGAAAAMRSARAASRTAPPGSITINYTPRAGYSGPDSFAIVAISPGGRSNPATVSLAVVARPDPARNSEVQGIVNAQVSSVKRLGQSQIANVSGRLEQLHDEDLPAVSMGLAFTAPEERNEPRAFREATDPNYRSARHFSDLQKLNKDLDQSMGKPGGARPAKKQEPTTFAIWTAGTISLGQLNNQGGTTSRFTSEGVTAGIDMRVMDGLRVGLAVGFGADRTKVGTLGSRNSGTNVSGTLYASYRLMPQTFLDVLAGYGHVRLASRRFDTVNSVFLQGDRTGHEFHGAVALTYEARWGKWKLAPYGRIEFLHVNLNGFTEDGLGIAALSFGSLQSTSYSGVLGFRTSYPFEMGWGTLTPMLRVEYRQTSEGGYTQAMGYADTGLSNAFSIVNRSSGSGQLTLGIGAKAVFDRGGALDIEHQFSTSTSTSKNFSNTTRGRYILNF
jgi:outer membrane autotransporter protein